MVFRIRMVVASLVSITAFISLPRPAHAESMPAETDLEQRCPDILLETRELYKQVENWRRETGARAIHAITQKRQDAVSPWLPHNKSRYAYDENGRIVQFARDHWYDSQWHAFSSIQVAWGEDDAIETLAKRTWDGKGSQTGDYATHFEHDSKRITKIGFRLDNMANGTIDSFQAECAYAASGAMASVIAYDKNDSRPLGSLSFGNGTLRDTITAFSFSKESNDLVAKSRSENVYDKNGYLLEANSWEIGSGVDPCRKSAYTYLSDTVYAVVETSREGDAWELTSLDTFRLTSSGRLLRRTHSSTDSLGNTRRWIMRGFPGGSSLPDSTHFYRFIDNEWVLVERTVFEKQSTGLSFPSSQPNQNRSRQPTITIRSANGIAHLVFSRQPSMPVDISLFSPQGQLVHRRRDALPKAGVLRLPPNLSAGHYVYRVESDGGEMQGTVVLRR